MKSFATKSTRWVSSLHHHPSSLSRTTIFILPPLHNNSINVQSMQYATLSRTKNASKTAASFNKSEVYEHYHDKYFNQTIYNTSGYSQERMGTSWVFTCMSEKHAKQLATEIRNTMKWRLGLYCMQSHRNYIEVSDLDLNHRDAKLLLQTDFCYATQVLPNTQSFTIGSSNKKQSNDSSSSSSLTSKYANENNNYDGQSKGSSSDFDFNAAYAKADGKLRTAMKQSSCKELVAQIKTYVAQQLRRELATNARPWLLHVFTPSSVSQAAVRVTITIFC